MAFAAGAAGGWRPARPSWQPDSCSGWGGPMTWRSRSIGARACSTCWSGW